MLQLLAEMISDLERDMKDLLQNKDKNRTKRKIQEIKDRLISDWQHLNLVQDQDINKDEKGEDDMKNPYNETKESSKSSHSSTEKKA